MQTSESHNARVPASGKSESGPLTESALRDLLVRHETEAWPLDRLLILCVEFQAGTGSPTIARRLGTTKNAVVGKSHRLMDAGILPSRANPVHWAPDDPRRSATPYTPRLVPVITGPTLPALASLAAPVHLRVSGPVPSPEGLSPAWCAGDLAILRTMWGEGSTGPAIATSLGKTPAAIYVKARRIGLDTRLPLAPAPPGAPAPKPRPPIPAEAPLPIPVEAPFSRPPALKAASPPAPKFPASQPKTLLQPAKYAPVVSCCWPIGEPGTRTFHFCDVPSEPGRPYCPDHVKIGFSKISVRQRPRDDGYARPGPPP